MKMTYSPSDATVTVTKGDDVVAFENGETVEEIPFGTELNWKVEKIGFSTQSGTHTMVEEADGTENTVVVPALEDQTEVRGLSF